MTPEWIRQLRHITSEAERTVERLDEVLKQVAERDEVIAQLVRQRDIVPYIKPEPKPVEKPKKPKGKKPKGKRK